MRFDLLNANDKYAAPKKNIQIIKINAIELMLIFWIEISIVIVMIIGTMQKRQKVAK